MYRCQQTAIRRSWCSRAEVCSTINGRRQTSTFFSISAQRLELRLKAFSALPKHVDDRLGLVESGQLGGDVLRLLEPLRGVAVLAAAGLDVAGYPAQLGQLVVDVLEFLTQLVGRGFIGHGGIIGRVNDSFIGTRIVSFRD